MGGLRGKELDKKRKLAPAQVKKFGLKKAQNRRFKTRHAIAYAGKKESRTQYGQAFKDVDQPSFEYICSLSQAASRKFLEDHGVILKRKADAVFHCWGCGTTLNQKNKWRCSKRGCSLRAKHTQPLLSYTPLFHQAAGGADPDYRAALRAAYCLGCKLSNDSAAHFVRAGDQTWTAARHKVNDFYHRYKLTLAWQNCLDNNEISFTKDFVEVDSGRFGVKKRKAGDPRGTPKAQNIGRSLVMVGRFARQWLVKGLPDRGGSSSRLGPETSAEVTPTIAKKMGSATILCPDGAKAFAAAARTAKKPVLKGVQHGKRLFTPTASLQKTSLDSTTTKFLQKASGSKVAAAKNYKKKFVAAAGDNLAEGLVSNLKFTARRFNAIRGGRAQTTKNKAVVAQSSAAILRQCGLSRVLQSAKAFRQACSDGLLNMSPRECYQYDKHSWLTDADL
eukprot:s2944_g1.t1